MLTLDPAQREAGSVEYIMRTLRQHLHRCHKLTIYANCVGSFAQIFPLSPIPKLVELSVYLQLTNVASDSTTLFTTPPSGLESLHVTVFQGLTSLNGLDSRSIKRLSFGSVTL